MDESHEDIEQLAVNTIRTLSMDAVQKANSGHPGTAMALAPVVYTLWHRFLRYDPDEPMWPNRDRFVLSIGHASMLLYSTLYLVGVKASNPQYETLGELAVNLEDIKNFRQLDSRCPGHPERGWTAGVETTTGPLGQGVATSVGMAIAGRWLGARYNQPEFTFFDYDVYALCGDGCMMEGVASEAASMAGHQGLANLCWVYDNNKITIEGHTDWAFTEDVATRFISYGWNVTRVGDANDLEMISSAFEQFKEEERRPTLIIIDSHIAYGSPNKQDTHGAHGEPLGVDEVRLTKRTYGWPEDRRFFVPEFVKEHFKTSIGERGRELRSDWNFKLSKYREIYPQLANELEYIESRELPPKWDFQLSHFEPDLKGISGREASGIVLNQIAEGVPWLLGGAADLAPSSKTRLEFEDAGDLSAEDPAGRNIHFGVREHAMAAILNGLALSKLRPFGAGFLIFSDYAKPAIRLSAMMDLPVVHIFTHDSIGVGEDGPTHQPIEHLAALRSIPGLITIRPADANEVAEAWRVIMRSQMEPTALVLSRQSLPVLDRRDMAAASGLQFGAYVLAGSQLKDPKVLLIASGSEVMPCVEVHKKLLKEGIESLVISMPSWELFERQSARYRHSVIPPQIKARVTVEQASTLGWSRYAGEHGAMIGMETFGASAPLKALQEKFGFTADRIEACAKAQIAAIKRGKSSDREEHLEGSTL